MQTKVSTRGQVVLPKAIREKRRWKAGTCLTIEERPDGILLKPVERKKPFTIADWRGMLQHDGPPHTIEEMNAGIEEEARRRHARGRY